MGSQRILTSVKLWVGVVLYLSSSFYHERQCIHKFQELGRGGLLETIFFLPTLLGFKKILWFSLAEFLQLIISSINILIAHIINLRHTFKKEEEEVVLSFFFFSITAGKIIFTLEWIIPLTTAVTICILRFSWILKISLLQIFQRAKSIGQMF